MTAGTVRVSERWLALREPADAAARSRDLVEVLVRRRPPTGRQVIHDLGCGSGAMGRWLAPRLPGRQHWVLHDRDPDLLAAARADFPGPAADGDAVTLEAKRSDIGLLHPDDLAGATLITVSALLDMLTEDELAGLIRLCMATQCPTLITLSVVGRVELTPGDPLDGRVAAAFNAHQRRGTNRGRLLGPDGPAAATQEFGRLGAEVLKRPSPWRIDAASAELLTEWFAGWVGAAREQEPELAAELNAYTRRRRAEVTAGQLEVTVDHDDLLVLPPQSRSAQISSGRERDVERVGAPARLRD